VEHVAAVYQPGERELAVEFVEALGCVAADTRARSDSGSPFISVHPNPDDRDPLNNVLYLSEMMPQQLALERALTARMEIDPALREARKAYGNTALASPASVPHFALNFPSMAALEPVLERLASGLRPELADRVSTRVYDRVRLHRYHRVGDRRLRPAHRTTGPAAQTGRALNYCIGSNEKGRTRFWIRPFAWSAAGSAAYEAFIAYSKLSDNASRRKLPTSLQDHETSDHLLSRY
jgi:hypothetical protein